MTTIQSIFGEDRGSTTTRRSHSAVSQSTNWFIVFIVGVLIFLGLTMAYSTTFYRSVLTDGNPFAVFLKQLLALSIGMVLFVFLSRTDYGVWRKLSLPLIGLSIIALVGVLLFGDTVLGAKRTVLHGSIQPSEPIKILVLLYGATWLASRREQVTSFTNGLLPFAVIVGFIAALIALQPDLSTGAVIVIAASAMFFLAGANLFQIAVVGVSTVGVFVLLLKIFKHAAERWDAYILSLSNPSETAYHIKQSILAFGGGGLLGKGIGNGSQKFLLLPFPHTDSVFAVLGEEMGLLGVMVTLGLFVLLAYGSFRIAQKADTVFGSFWAIGIITWIMMQTLLNLLAMTGMIPLPGVPVPFLSVGGSSLVSVLAACGILVSISRGSKILNERDDQKSGGNSLRGGISNSSASSTIRRRNSRPRVTRSGRAELPEVDSSTDIIGRDIKFSAGLRRGSTRTGNSGSVPGRTGRNRTGSRYTRGS